MLPCEVLDCWVPDMFHELSVMSSPLLINILDPANFLIPKMLSLSGPHGCWRLKIAGAGVEWGQGFICPKMNGLWELIAAAKPVLVTMGWGSLSKNDRLQEFQRQATWSLNPLGTGFTKESQECKYQPLPVHFPEKSIYSNKLSFVQIHVAFKCNILLCRSCCLVCQWKSSSPVFSFLQSSSNVLHDGYSNCPTMVTQHLIIALSARRKVPPALWGWSPAVCSSSVSLPQKPSPASASLEDSWPSRPRQLQHHLRPWPGNKTGMPRQHWLHSSGPPG